MKTYLNTQDDTSGNQVKTSIPKLRSFLHISVFNISPSQAACKIQFRHGIHIIIIILLFILEAKIIKMSSKFQTSENKPQDVLV